MCGLFGVVQSDGGVIDLHRARHARDTLTHRGPDQAGEFAAAGVYLGHRRLSILDTSADATQPMSCAGVSVTVNGEIYNFLSLRRELEQAGHVFKSASDSEVVLHGYRHWGIGELLHRLEGMYAALVYDQNLGRVLAFRDRIGIKPFYYYHHAGQMVWASELKAICDYLPQAALQIDPRAVLDFLVYRYLPAPRALYRSVHKLPAAGLLEYEVGSDALKVSQYWSLADETAAGEDQAYTRELLEKLEASVASQLVSDVPLGLLLSGGLDSSAVAAFASRHAPGMQSFSLGFPDASRDETPVARSMAQAAGTQHFTTVFAQENMTGVAERLQARFDEPFGDTSAFPTEAVCAFARQRVTVALSGDGGDELFGGYRWYERYAKLYQRLRRWPWRPPTGWRLPAGLPLSDLVQLNSIGDPLWLYAVLRGSLPPARVQDWKRRLGIPADYDELWAYRAAFRPHLSARRAAQVMDFHTYLPDDILTKVDRVSMAVSLECRPALLSRSTVEFAFMLPDDFIYRGGAIKGGLRHALSTVLPAAVITQPKQGFSVPDMGWRQQLISEYGSVQEALLQPYLDAVGDLHR